MKVVYFKDAESYEPEKDWRRVSLCQDQAISIEHFVKPAHHASPKHSHPNAQILIVLSGRLKIKTDHQTVELGPFDTAYIDGNEEHVVINPLAEPSAGLDIFVPGRAFDFWLKRKK